MSMNDANYDRTRRRSRMMIIGGGVIALLVGGTVLASLLFVNQVTKEDEPVMRTVVTAARDIPGRKPIEESDLVMRTVIDDPSVASAFTRIDEVLGRVSSVSIPSGQVVTRNLLASSTTGQTFSILIPGEKFDENGPDMRAVSVTVPDAMAVGGTIQAGHRIDLVATITFNPQLTVLQPDAGDTDEEAAPSPTGAPLIPGPTTRTTLQNITVLERAGPVYILRADLNTAEKLGELIAAGAQFMMVLRPDEDERMATTDGSTLETLVDEFGFLPPKAPPFDGRPGFGDDEAAAEGSAEPSATPSP